MTENMGLPLRAESQAVKDVRLLREAHERGEHTSRDIWCSSCLSEGGAKSTARRMAARKGAAKRGRRG